MNNTIFSDEVLEHLIMDNWRFPEDVRSVNISNGYLFLSTYVSNLVNFSLIDMSDEELSLSYLVEFQYMVRKAGRLNLDWNIYAYIVSCMKKKDLSVSESRLIHETYHWLYYYLQRYFVLEDIQDNLSYLRLLYSNFIDLYSLESHFTGGKLHE